MPVATTTKPPSREDIWDSKPFYHPDEPNLEYCFVPNAGQGLGHLFQDGEQVATITTLTHKVIGGIMQVFDATVLFYMELKFLRLL